MKKILALVLALLFCVQGIAVFADNLLIMSAPKSFPFKDVTESDWYYNDVKSAYEMELIDGKGVGTYKPNDNMTYAEVAKLAACMHQKYTEGKVTLENGTPWYQSFVDYCKEKGIIAKEYNYNDEATRAGYMEIFAKALPDEGLKQINLVPDGFIPDVKLTAEYAPAVYKLYEAGILAGSDAKHSCKPNDSIKRSEVAAILSRMMNAEKRLSVGFEKEKENEVTFGVFSDVHALPNSKDFEKALNNIFTLSNEGKDLDGLVLVGDIVYLATNDSLPSANTYSVLNSNTQYAQMKSEGKLVYAMGNHEFPLNAKDKEKCDLSKKVFTEETGLTPEKVTVLNGYTFITAGPNTYANDLNPEQEKFIMDSVKDALADGTDKPVFLIIHQPVDQTLYGTSNYNNYSPELEAFLKEQPRLVVFSGHMHYPSSDPQTIYQVPGGATFVYTTSVMGGNGARTPYVSAENRHANWPSQGIMLKVNTDTNVVTLKRFYVSTGLPEYLEGGDWTLDIPAMIDEKGSSTPDLNVYKYTTARKDASKAPEFKAGDKITVSEITEFSAKATFPVPKGGPEGEDNVAAYYKIELTNKATGEVVKSAKVLSDYFLKSKKDTFSYTFIDLTSQTDFKLTVTPINPWNIESTNPLTVEFSTLVPKFKEVKLNENNSVEYTIAEAQRSGGGTLYPKGEPVPNLIQIGSTSRANLRYIADMTKPGKYRVFFYGGAQGSVELQVDIASADVTYTETASGAEKITVKTKENLVDDTFTFATGNLTTLSEIPCADFEVKEPGTFSIRFKKYETPYTIGHSGIRIVEIAE